MREPQAQPPYRVPNTPIDEMFEKDKPPAPIRPAVGTVTSVSSTDNTFEVNDADETITVVPLGVQPAVGDQVDYYVVDGLAYSPEPSVGAVAVFVQPDDPGVHIIGTLWFDTDEPVP